MPQNPSRCDLGQAAASYKQDLEHGTWELKFPAGVHALTEQENVRSLIRVLRSRLGNWVSVERVLPVSHGVRVDPEVSTSDAIYNRASEIMLKLLDRIERDIEEGKSPSAHMGRNGSHDGGDSLRDHVEVAAHAATVTQPRDGSPDAVG